MNDPELVADASAVLAFLKKEAFQGFDPERLIGAAISAVNLSEVLAKLGDEALIEDEAHTAVAALDLAVIAFDEWQAQEAAQLRPLTRRAGLSLGDRACLALAIGLQKPVATGDRVWASLGVGVDVILIR